MQRQPTQSNTLVFKRDDRTLLKFRLKNRKRSLEYYADHLNLRGKGVTVFIDQAVQ